MVRRKPLSMDPKNVEARRRRKEKRERDIAEGRIIPRMRKVKEPKVYTERGAKMLETKRRRIAEGTTYKSIKGRTWDETRKAANRARLDAIKAQKAVAQYEAMGF